MGQTIDNNDVTAVWGMLRKEYGVIPINYKAAIGKILKRVLTARLCIVNRKATKFMGNPTRLLSFFKFVLLPYTPGQGDIAPLTEIKNACHETQHRYDQTSDPKGAVNWYKNYFRYKASRIESEVKAVGAEMAVAYAVTGKLPQSQSLSSSVYMLTAEEAHSTLLGIGSQRRTLDRCGRGSSTSPVSSSIIRLLKARGIDVTDR